jgi:hypothetical protein
VVNPDAGSWFRPRQFPLSLTARQAAGKGYRLVQVTDPLMQVFWNPPTTTSTR